MSRAQRLLELVQVLRSRRRPVAGLVLAEEIGVSLRTLYRDIETLRAQGAPIDGEAGMGFVLRPGFMLPPLMFSEEEIEALVLGSRWVSERADGPLARAARNALAKIGAVLPKDLTDSLDTSGMLIVGAAPIAAGDAELAAIRQAIRQELRIEISYADEHGVETSRSIWPFALGFFERVRIIVAWCELRQAYRHFRTDRITALSVSKAHYPRRRAAMMKEWRATQGLKDRPLLP